MIDVNEVFENQNVAKLAEAVRDGNEKNIKELVTQGIDPNAIGDRDTSLLFWAMLNQSKRGFKALLNAGADPTIPDKNGRTMLHIAAAINTPEYLAILLDYGMDPNIKNTEGGETPLFDAVGEQSHLQFDRLIDAGADINAQDIMGDSVLHHAASTRNTSSVIKLLEMGANPNIKNNQGKTFQSSFFRMSEDVMTDKGKQKRQWVKKWLHEHNIPIED